MLVMDWHGGHGDTRSSTTAGADPHRASTPTANLRRPIGRVAEQG
jgi:hypothetical protein